MNCRCRDGFDFCDARASPDVFPVATASCTVGPRGNDTRELGEEFTLESLELVAALADRRALLRVATGGGEEEKAVAW